MKLAEPIEFNRKSGGAQWSDCLFCQAGMVEKAAAELPRKTASVSRFPTMVPGKGYGKDGSGAASENALRFPLSHNCDVGESGSDG
jgi:hypothetical protein